MLYSRYVYVRILSRQCNKVNTFLIILANHILLGWLSLFVLHSINLTFASISDSIHAISIMELQKGCNSGVHRTLFRTS